MTWLVLTGVNGFIGHNLALDLLFPNAETSAPKVDFVLGIDLPDSEGRATHARLLGTPNYHYGSGIDAVTAIQERTSVWGEPPLAVIHNGACSSTSVTDPKIFQVQNVEASQTLFRYCAQVGIPFLYASSASVYGTGSQGFSDDFKDHEKYSPLNLYGRSKHDFDSWVMNQTAHPPVWFGLRYFNVFGPFEAHKLGQASIFLWGRQQIESTGRLKLFESHQAGLANGHQKRDFVSVFDVTRVTWKLLELIREGLDLPQKGRFVNIGRGEAVTWLDIGGALFDAMGRPTAFDFVPMPEQLRAHYQYYTQADLSSLRELGITAPFLGLQEAFEKAIAAEASAKPAV